MENILFVVSDIHGHFNELIVSLKNAGYDLNNPHHKLLVLGDLFDRGTQSKEVLEYLYSLSLDKKVEIIIGNHDLFLIDFLENQFQKTIFNIIHNGFLNTLESLSELELEMDFKKEEISELIRNKFPYLLNWLKSFPYFIEMNDYIFVHGGINGSMKNWRDTSLRDFVWSYEHELKSIPNKIVVAGHHRTASIRRPYESFAHLIDTNPEMFDILYEKGKILIDGFVEVSKKINVLIIEF
ncbi:MAG: fructose-bisphosphatase class III [Firmicutes bacterium]|nr:fructose-bisphosphatase class III [Bacillota bacterium]